MKTTTGHYPLGLKLIGGFKVVCSMLLIALGAGFFHEAHGDFAATSSRLIAALKLDPDNHYIHSAIAWASGLSPGQLQAIGVGTFLYATLYLVEGVGLLLGKHWAEYFTVIVTGIFIPLEIYEISRRTTIIRIGLLVINSAIVAYLVYQIRSKPAERSQSDPGGSGTESPPVLT